MSEHDRSRRAFLVQAVVGAGAAAGAGLVPAAAEAQAAASGPMAGHQAAAPAIPLLRGLGAFFNDDDEATMVALTERIMPGAPGKPGATEANVVNYIDLALSGAYQDQQDFYRRGLLQLEAHCQASYAKSFRRLPAAQQDEVIGALESGKATGFDYPTAKAFFARLRTHTMEGMFADPIYGGNAGFAGWRLVGFPGAQMQYTPEDLASREAFAREPIVGLRS